MQMFQAAMAVAAVFFGAVGALLGAIVTISAIATGEISLIRGDGPAVTMNYYANPALFMMQLFMVGVFPLVIGFVVARWGWSRINYGS